MGANNDSGSGIESSLTAEVDDRLDSFFGDDEDEPKDSFQETSTTAEVNDRLDDLFGSEQDTDTGGAQREIEIEQDPDDDVNRTQIPVADDSAEYNVDNSILKELKAIVLSLEWEITDQVMDRLGDEITRLEQEFSDDKIIVAFLQLLASLGKYIQKKRADAHPDSISLLNSVYDSMEKVMLSDDLTEAAKKKMLITEVNKYKQLKEQIATMKTAPPRRAEPRVAPEPVMAYEEEDQIGDEPEPSVVDFPSEKAEPVVSADVPMPMEAAEMGQLVLAIRELNETIRQCFGEISQELKRIRQHLEQ